MTDTTAIAGKDNGKPDKPEKTATVYVNDFNRPIVVPKKVTGLQIKAAAGVPSTHELFEIKNNDEDPVDDNKEITVKGGDRFIATPSLDPS